ncbi:MAG: flavodoxin family protein [Defluviitaleaceae bacterium]|nr:flavodoxin family protein [Defluviitaleaceae bacterium]
MKVMGIASGRKGGNSEALLKEALLACQEKGAEVSMINLHDFNILHCNGCEGCMINIMKGGKDPFCVYKEKDDYFMIAEKMMEMDAIIITAPTYDLMPASIYLAFAHRGLPFEVSLLEKQGIIDEAPDRVCGLISMGGSTRSWQSMALEGLAATTFMGSLEVVDMMLATGNSAYGQVFLKPEQIARARKLGENIFEARSTPKGQRKWMGEEDMGLCPVCHANAIAKGEVHWDGVHFPLECIVCGAGGDLVQGDDGKYKFVLAENGMSRVRVDPRCRDLHLDEIKENHKTTGMNREKIQPLIQKYKAIEIPKTLESKHK